MRLVVGSLLPAICLATAATPPMVFTHDPQTAFGTLDPVAARLVLAQRIGVEDYHSADLESAGVINAINEYGARQSLFAADETVLRKAFILLEDKTMTNELSGLKVKQTGFEIAPAPDALAIRSLFLDLAKQSDPRAQQLTDDDLFEQLSKGQSPPKAGDMFYVAKRAKDFAATFESLLQEDWSITALIAPPADQLSASRQPGQWGTYEMPGSQSALKKRQQKETPLTETSSYKPVHSTSVPFTPLADSTPLRGILPSCFASQAACESATRNCTGHGGCQLKYHDEGARGNKDCYSCLCKATKSADGKSTTVWAGPACQKKDISVQFWLIALFSVGLVFLIGFAVGQIWEMGEQELPSVIGAGVSGPSARK